MQVQLFLLRLKRLWATPERITLSQRKKNLQSMMDLGISYDDLRQMCMSLRPEDRRAGPVPHDGGLDGDVWVFTPTYRDAHMYLKFRLLSRSNQDYIEVISCHKEGMF